MALPDLIYGNEVLVGLLSLLLLFIAIGSRRYLSHRSTWVFRLRRVIWPALDRVLRPRGRPTTRCKDADEYVMTVQAPLSDINEAFDDYGHDVSVASTLKHRTLKDGSKQYSVATWVYREPIDGKWQHHAYIFPNPVRPGYDIYHHKEINTNYDPEGHTSGERTKGDPNGVLTEVFKQYTEENTDQYLQECN